jgi:flagellar biogenesis protein FliO
MRRIANAALFCLLLSGIARAAETFDETRLLHSPASSKSVKSVNKIREPGESNGKKPTGNWWTTMGSLLAVVALIYLTAKVLKKGLPASQPSLPAEVVEVLGRKSLDHRNSLHLVRFGSKILILGSSQAGLTSLSEISDPGEVEHLTGLCQPAETATVGLSFQQLIRKFQTPESAIPPTAMPPDAAVDAAAILLKSRFSHPVGSPPEHPSNDRFEELAG